MQDVAGRVTNRIQLTTDGLATYMDAVYKAFGNEIDYAMFIKICGPDSSGAGRYSPPVVKSVSSDVHCGTPDKDHISTSYVERSNLTMRMSMRRFTRLTNGFSKKLANHEHAIAIYTVHYNYCRVHKTLRVTPAMEAKISDHVWEIEELVALID